MTDIGRALREAFDHVAARWSLTGAEIDSILDQGEAGSALRAGYAIAISLGLGALFNENAEAERQWLRASRISLGSKTPLSVMQAGLTGLRMVNNLVTRDRGFVP